MKVLMINVVCGIRSTGRICTDLAVALEKEGHEVKIAYGREEVPEQFQKYAVKIGNSFDVKLHGLKARFFDASGFGSQRVTQKFIEWIRLYDPDIIHLHNIHGYYVNVKLLFDYLRNCHKKIIWTLHDCWALTGHSAYCDAVNCEQWKNGCYQCPQMLEYPKSIIDCSKSNWIKKKKCFSDIDNLKIITPSYWLKGVVERSFLKRYPVKVIHNGIDTSEFRRMKSDFREIHKLTDKFVLLGVASNWNDLKGYADFIKLAQMLDDTCCIVLVGVSAEQMKELPSNIIGIQTTNNTKELAQIYSAANLFLNLTYCDNYPTVNLEAIACGTPVITYKTGGSPESLKFGEGMSILQGDIESVYKCVKRYIEAGVANVTMPTTKWSRESISIKWTVNEYMREYESLK